MTCYDNLLPCDQGEAELACRLALSNVMGPALVLGDASPVVLLGLAAAASGIVLVGEPEETEALEALVAPWTPAWMDGIRAKDPIPDVPGGFGAVLVVGDTVPEVAEVEAAVARAAHGAPVVIDVQVDDAARAGRLDRLIRGVCAPGVTRPPRSPRGRFSLVGVRSSPDGGSDRIVELLDPIPVSVVVVASGPRVETEALLADVLVRQTHSPAQVLVVDRGEAADRLPDNLFGLAAAAPGTVALVTAGPRELPDVVDDALGGVDQPYVSVLRSGDRIAPNHLAALGLLAETVKGVSAVTGAGAVLGRGGSVDRSFWPAADAAVAPRRHLLAGGNFLSASTLFCSEALRTVNGLDPAFGEAALEEVWTRVTDAGPIALHPAPLAGMTGFEPRPLSRVIGEALAARGPETLLREMPEVPRDRRLEQARREVVVGALRVNRPDLARGVLEGTELDPVLEVRILLAEERHDDVLERTAVIEDPVARALAEARALAGRGDDVAARERIRTIGDVEAAHLLHLFMVAGGDPGITALIASRRLAGGPYTDWLPG